MSSEGGLEDFSMMDLFRSEVETHSEVLNAALLALERSPGDTSRVDEMMRSAHSIKGAARVVGVDPAVSVAHVMEDCFVAAQKGVLTLTPADVDILLRGVDLLGKISEATKDPRADLAITFEESVRSIVVELEAMLVCRDAPQQPTPAAAAPAPLEPAVTAPSPQAITLVFPDILDATAAEELRRKLLEVVEHGNRTVQLDLRSTRDLDVQGLTLLAAIPKHAAKHGRPAFRLAGVSPEMSLVLTTTGLAEAYGIGPRSTREDA